MTEHSNIVLIACGVFRPELKFLQAKGALPLRMRYLDSRWHMDPEGLKERLDRVIQDERSRGNAIVLLYGDCHPHMVDQSNQTDIVRIQGSNCCRILLGKEAHKLLIKEKRAFILHPEWTNRWREILVERMGREHMGLGEKDTIDFLRSVYSCFVYLDTGVQPIPREPLAACSDFFGLPYEVREVSVEPLFLLLEKAVDELVEKVTQGC